MNRSLLNDRRGASAAEFALVLPLLILLLFGLIDAGRYMWQWNTAEKAAQAGARFAAVTNTVASGLLGVDFVNVGTLTQGDVIPANSINPMTCTDNGTTATCSCSPSCINGVTTSGNHAAFNAILARMKLIDPLITAPNVQIIYRGSGLGYAGDPDTTKPQVSPLITVNITSIPFTTLSSLTLLSTRITNISATMTAEDSSGTVSN